MEVAPLQTTLIYTALTSEPSELMAEMISISLLAVYVHPLNLENAFVC